MPKRSINVNNFSGGLNSVASIRDLKPNQFTQLEGLDNEIFGKLVTLGKIDDVSTSGTLPTSVNDGNGLLHFNTDYNIVDASEASKEYIAYHDKANRVVKFIDLSDSNTIVEPSTDSVTVATSGTGNIDMFVADGNLRVCREYPNNTPKIVSRIEYTRNFGTSGSQNENPESGKMGVNSMNVAPIQTNTDGTGIYDNKMLLSSGSGPRQAANSEVHMFPDSSLTYYENTSGTANNGRVALSPALINTKLGDTASSTGTMGCIAYFDGAPSTDQADRSDIVVYGAADKRYGLWGTLIYDGVQESGPTFLGIIHQPNMTENLNHILYLSFIGREPGKDRVTGFKVYWGLIDSYKEVNNEVFGEVDSRYLLAEVNYEKGVRLSGVSGYSSFEEITGATSKYYYVYPPSASTPTYLQGQILTKLSTEEPLLSNTHTVVGRDGTGWKTSTILNRKAYIGNVRYYNKEGTLVTKNDRVLKSNVNSFDFFEEDDFIDVEINDGEDITVLENLGGRLLQFKQNTLYIINVSRDIEFLEGTYDYRGCLKQSHLVKAEGFVAWFNKHGIFLYDGNSLVDLVQDKDTGQNLINWKNDYDDTMKIGFVPFKKQLIIFDKTEVSDYDNGKIYVFDLKSGSFTTELRSGYTSSGYEVFPSNDTSNFINDNNGDLFCLEASQLKKWQTNSSTKIYNGGGQVLMKTKEFDFGSPDVPKNLNAVQITATAGENISVQVIPSTNGSNDGNAVTIGSLDTSTDRKVQKFTISSSNLKSSALEKVYAYTLQLVTGGNSGTQKTINSNFSIDDIQFIYREKVLR